MTGHSINTQQNQEFLTTMHTMIDDLDTISSNINEITYLRLVNGLQRLYNIHNSELQASTSVREIWIRQQHQIGDQENNLSQNIIRHYELVNDISGVPINANAEPIINNADPYPVNSSNIINSTIANVIDYINNDYWNENNTAQNRNSANANANANDNANDNARISYTSVTSNHWIEAALREGLRSAH
jgi:hypothetical protein